MTRYAVRLASGRSDCAAWRYPGTTGSCVIMAGGAGIPKELGTGVFAERFNAAGHSVLTFDYRHLGQSGGHPRQIVSIHRQLADWRAGLDYAAGLPDVDPGRIGICGFSLAGGHVVRIAASHPRIAAAIAQTPLTDGRAAARSALRHSTPKAAARLFTTAVLDGLGGLIGRRRILIPTAGEPGSVALLTTPDALDATPALDRHHTHPDWRQEVAARLALRIGNYRPGTAAARVQCPLLVVVCEGDQAAAPQAASVAARRAPRGELLRLSGGHYAPFLESHERAVDAELAFLHTHLDEPGRPA